MIYPIKFDLSNVDDKIPGGDYCESCGESLECVMPKDYNSIVLICVNPDCEASYGT